MEAPIAQPDGGRGFSLAASAGGPRRPLVDQSQLAVALFCGLTTSIGNDFARAIAEREAHQCKTQSYSDIQHREKKAPLGRGLVLRQWFVLGMASGIGGSRTIEDRPAIKRALAR